MQPLKAGCGKLGLKWARLQLGVFDAANFPRCKRMRCSLARLLTWSSKACTPTKCAQRAANIVMPPRLPETAPGGPCGPRTKNSVGHLRCVHLRVVSRHERGRRRNQKGAVPCRTFKQVVLQGTAGTAKRIRPIQCCCFALRNRHLVWLD